ncbi:MAG: 30S ribosomal protein S6 [Planctomycetes bacterium]|nr:30S ribosomal protein S6 [Planctomycetota bacterium]
MSQIYEGMFLLDNAAVRQDWNAAKSIVTGTLEKHGGTVLTARRWDERRLAYPIKKKNRATFLLAYYTMPGANIPDMRRDLELNETVLRSLELAVDAVPEGEQELHAHEQTTEFSVPTPPDDDHVDFVEQEEEEYVPRGRRRRDEDDDSDSEDAEEADEASKED